MTYALVKTVDTLPDGVEPLLVEGRNKVFVPHTKIFVREITTFVYGYKVQLRDDLLLVVRKRQPPTPRGGIGLDGQEQSPRALGETPSLVSEEDPCRCSLVA